MRRLLVRPAAALAMVLAGAAQAHALSGRLIVLDRSATTGSVNVVYKTPGPVYSMPIGGGAVAAEVTIRVDGRDTLFSVPEGVYDGSAGWKANDAARALFLNKEAPGGPTAARKMMVRAPGGVSMVAKGLGDTAALDVIAPPAGTVDVQYAVTSGGVTGRTCTRFAAGACAHKSLDGGAGAKLVCRDGLADPSCVAFGGTPGGFTCTEILGFSQTLMWYETPEFQGLVDDARYQLRFRAGGDLDLWADPNADAWRAPVRTDCLGSGNVVLCSPCAQGSNGPDRVILTATLQAYESDVQVWAQKLRAAIAQIRRQHPGVRQIVLQPVVGGPNDNVCSFPGAPQGVRASYNHPHLDDAIALVVGDSPDLVAGISPSVPSCSAYEDDVGHLTPSARGPVGRTIGLYYQTHP
jgi:hypothetical protein